MRFTSVGPKWRAALRSSFLSLLLPSCPLGCRYPLLPPAASVYPFVRPSVHRYLSSSPAHSGPRGTAQTAGMHQMHRADRYPSPLPLVYFGRLPLPVSPPCVFPCLSFTVLRFFFLRSATPPPRATLASFTSFCRRRRRRRCHSRVRTASLPPV